MMRFPTLCKILAWMIQRRKMNRASRWWTYEGMYSPFRSIPCPAWTSKAGNSRKTKKKRSAVILGSAQPKLVDAKHKGREIGVRKI